MQTCVKQNVNTPADGVRTYSMNSRQFFQEITIAVFFEKSVQANVMRKYISIVLLTIIKYTRVTDEI